MKENPKYYDTSIFFIGLIAVFGVVFTSLSFEDSAPLGYMSYDSDPFCWKDCSCRHRDVCEGNPTCAWVGTCSQAPRWETGSELYMVTPSLVVTGTTFTVNAIVKPRDGVDAIVILQLPNGFTTDDPQSQRINLQKGQTGRVSWDVEVKNLVAEQDHKFMVYAINEVWRPVWKSETQISVKWLKQDKILE